MRAELRDSLENLYPDSRVGKAPRRPMTLDVARGGTAAVHLLLNELKAGSAVRVRLRAKRREIREAQWFRLADVPVEVNTGPAGFVEKEGETNPSVVRRAPFRTYDAMGPAGGSVQVTSETMALRLHLPIPADGRAGERRYGLEVQSGRQVQELALGVRAHAPVIPPAGQHSLPYTNWFSVGTIAERHGLRAWSEAHWRMIARYAALMARCRQNTFWCPLNLVFRREKGTLVLDAPRLRRYVRTFTAAGMHHIEGGHFGHRSTSQWKCATFSIGLTKSLATSAEGNTDIACISRQLMAEIERNGWRRRWIQHIADEPIRENSADYRIFAGMVRKYMPGIPILDATMELGLVGAVDIWCPQAQEYEARRKHFEAQRAVGDRVWFYTCCSPGGPWLNRLLDMELLRPALFGWAAALYGLDGFLHWGLNYYRQDQDPFQKSVVRHGANALPAGDTHVVYPGTEGPWSSLRLEAQREGFEDYELLRTLRERSPRKAVGIIRRAISSFDRYAKDVRVFRGTRRALLEAL